MVYVFLNKAEVKLLKKKWNPATTKTVRGSPHTLINIDKAALEKIKKHSGRKKGVTVKHNGKKYHAFPPPPRKDNFTPVRTPEFEFPETIGPLIKQEKFPGIEGELYKHKDSGVYYEIKRMGERLTYTQISDELAEAIQRINDAKNAFANVKFVKKKEKKEKEK